jgi:hypothetical protein
MAAHYMGTVWRKFKLRREIVAAIGVLQTKLRILSLSYRGRGINLWVCYVENSKTYESTSQTQTSTTHVTRVINERLDAVVVVDHSTCMIYVCILYSIVLFRTYMLLIISRNMHACEVARHRTSPRPRGPDTVGVPQRRIASVGRGTKHVAGTSRWPKPGTTPVIASSSAATSHTANVVATAPQHHAAAISNSG